MVTLRSILAQNVCHCCSVTGVTGLTTHNYNKLSLLQEFVAQHGFDVVCLYEILLNSSFENHDDRPIS